MTIHMFGYLYLFRVLRSQSRMQSVSLKNLHNGGVVNERNFLETIAKERIININE